MISLLLLVNRATHPYNGDDGFTLTGEHKRSFKIHQKEMQRTKRKCSEGCYLQEQKEMAVMVKKKRAEVQSLAGKLRRKRIRQG